MKTSSCKAKGRRAQNEFREMCLAWAEGLEPADIKCATMGETGSDLYFSPCALQIFPFDSVEVKNVEKLNIWKALEQMKAHGHTPILAFRRNGSEMYVALRAEDFFKIL